MLDANVKLSIVIPAKTERDQGLRDLLLCIKKQEFPKSSLEVLVITEGTSESAKAIGIRRAIGQVICIMATDNYIDPRDTTFLLDHYNCAMEFGAAYPKWYGCNKNMWALDRYFALVGGNDPLAFYMGKNDRACYMDGEIWPHSKMTFGDNGFFIRRELILESDMDNYFHIDNVFDIRDKVLPYATTSSINHFTGACGIFKFLKKRYRYGLQHAFDSKRRWHLVEKTPGDIWKLFLFIFGSTTLIAPLWFSIRGYLKIRDLAWFIHPAVCLLTVFTYAALMAHLAIRSLLRLSFAPMAARRA